MAKKPQPEFSVPPESITQGGSYVVDPAAGTVERVAFTRPAESGAAPEPRENEIVVAGDARQPAQE